jgi:hypothetical protein
LISVFALPHPGLLPSGEGEIAGRFKGKITVPGKLPDRPSPELKDISRKINICSNKTILICKFDSRSEAQRTRIACDLK